MRLRSLSYLSIQRRTSQLKMRYGGSGVIFWSLGAAAGVAGDSEALGEACSFASRAARSAASRTAQAISEAAGNRAAAEPAGGCANAASPGRDR